MSSNHPAYPTKGAGLWQSAKNVFVRPFTASSFRCLSRSCCHPRSCAAVSMPVRTRRLWKRRLTAFAPSASEPFYHGPVRAFLDDSLWSLLEKLSQSGSQAAIWHDPALAPLLLFWKRCYSACSMTSEKAENALLAVKQLKGQQLSSEDTAERMVRGKLNENGCVFPVRQLPPLLQDNGGSIWKDHAGAEEWSEDDQRLDFAEGNPHSSYYPPITPSTRTTLNKANGYKRKSAEERIAFENAKQTAPRPLTLKQLDSTTAALQRDLATRALPEEPALDDHGRPKKRRKKEATSARASSSADAAQKGAAKPSKKRKGKDVA